MPPPPKVVILDGSSLIYRAFFALPGLITADGTPTNAVYGFATMLLKVMQDEKPDVLLLAMEGGRTFRHDEFSGYKSHRPRTPDDLAVQTPLARELADAFRIPMVQMTGFEADDVIGSLSKRAAEAGSQVLIVTGDLDALQLVSPSVQVLVNRRGVSDAQLYDEAAVRERFGLTPAQLPDFKALKGDSSDNIPGVPGVGDKTASALIAQWGSVEELLAHIGEVKQNRVRENIEALASEIPLYKRLATVVTDLEIELDWDGWRHRGIDCPRARELFYRLEFRTLALRLPQDEAAVPPSPLPAGEPPALVVEELESLEAMAEWVRAQNRIVAVAAGRAGKSPSGPLVELVFAAGGGAVKFRQAGAGGEGLLAALDESLDLPSDIRRLGCGGSPRLAGWDLKNSLHALWGGEAPDGCDAIATDFDPALAAYLLNPGRSSYSLDALGREFGHAAAVDLAAGDRTAGQALASLSLREPVIARLREEGLLYLYEELELPLIPLLARIEAAGVRVDRDALASVSRRIAGRILEIESEATALVGRPINLGSPKQLQEVLFSELKLPPGRKTKTGFSTDSDVLQDLAAIHPLPEKILEYREISKLKSTYADSLVNLIDPRDQRVHTTLNQMVAATGRLSSSDPNLQNIPIRSEIGREIRAAFIPADGCRLVSADYSQIELRIMAHMSGDSGLVSAFQERQDVHAATAALIFGVPMEQVDRDQRRAAKTVNFAVLYGQREFGLSRQLRIDIKEARELIEQYFIRFPGVRATLDATLDQARRDGCVTTLPPWNRRRYIPAIHSGNRNERMAAEREAMNAPLQGTAADIMKVAMLRVDRALRTEIPAARIILQVHDELLVECPPASEGQLCELLRREMEASASLDAPLEVEVKSGDNWRDVTPAEG